MDLLSNLADIGYSLCKKRLVEIILALIGEIKLWVLIAKVERYIRHFSGTDITQLIRITENDYMEFYYSQDSLIINPKPDLKGLIEWIEAQI